MKPEHQKVWSELIPDLKRIPMEKLPRKSLSASVSEQTKFYLLCFVDASQNLYAATVYLHVRYGQSSTTQLIFAKCRLSPQRPSTTIPRLELMAMLIGVRALSFCEKKVRLPISRKILWSDSQCTLHWITTVKPLCLFVKNRVAELKKATNVEYRYVNTDSNPADWATRGKQVEELTSFWWEGPGWLKTSPEKWPQWNMPPIDNYMINKRESSLDIQTANGPMYEASLLCPVDTKGPFDLDAIRYSSLNKVLRITAFALRFISNCRSSNKRSGFLTASEIVFACKLWEKSSQERCYGDVFEAIKTGKSHNLVNRLSLQLDETGILRCYGRLSNANFEPETKWPTLMHPKDPFTRLIVESFHRKLLHGGIAHTLAQIRTRYWIPKGRSIVRKVVNGCQICIKHQGGPYHLPKMPQLPSSRVTSSPPFTWSGLDYFGPLIIKHNGGTQKVWVALFSCLAVRAVHLELVLNMSTDQFLLCLRRFVARRGKPTAIICDNAPQFKAAKSVMDKVWQRTIIDTKIKDFVASEGIQWKFITEMAPWRGGHYERLIGIVKRGLKKALGRLCLSLVQLQTTLTETEAIVNSRPLCFVGDDIEDGIILTPRHFLTLNPKCAMVGYDEICKGDSEFLPESSRESLIQDWKKGEAHLNEYWKQWQRSYLIGLRAFHTSLHKSPRTCSLKDPEINEVVLVKDLSMPRGK